MLYIWAGQTLAVIVALLIVIGFLDGIGASFTTGEIRSLVIGAVVGLAIPTYRWRKRQAGWIKREIELEERIRELEKVGAGQSQQGDGEPWQ